MLLLSVGGKIPPRGKVMSNKEIKEESKVKDKKQIQM